MVHQSEDHRIRSYRFFSRQNRNFFFDNVDLTVKKSSSLHKRQACVAFFHHMHAFPPLPSCCCQCMFDRKFFNFKNLLFWNQRDRSFGAFNFRNRFFHFQVISFVKLMNKKIRLYMRGVDKVKSGTCFRLEVTLMRLVKNNFSQLNFKLSNLFYTYFII